MAAFEDDLKQWTTLFEDDSGEHATDGKCILLLILLPCTHGP